MGSEMVKPIAGLGIADFAKVASKQKAGAGDILKEVLGIVFAVGVETSKNKVETARSRVEQQQKTKDIDVRGRELVAELHRERFGEKSKAMAYFKSLINIEYKRPATKREKPKPLHKHVTTVAQRRRIWGEWRALQSGLGKQGRVNQEEWLALVRTEFPSADLAFSKQVQRDVRQHKKLKRRVS